ncbi:NAD(P)-binding domain-containing protein [Rhizohabitans arisaemae]|uniref:NAD(P)-binding domain-containing protein n=1 Tax=Rhizohabitans arisaemae TaxID=2720610 RepID=UPI0024B13B98|nr:NAD(P)-binding domain-containing protein [Rhizohabitans arisaemae]
MTDPVDRDNPKYVVIGAGPAGLQLSYFLQEVGADYLCLEREAEPGCFFRTFPRHRRLISLNKVQVRSEDPEIRLRWDWNSLLNDSLMFPDYSRDYFPQADDLLRYLADFSRTHRLRVRYGTEVTRVSRTRSGFTLTTADGRTIRCECLIAATGWGAPYVPPIDGIEHALGYEDAPVDPSWYDGRRVLIIGKGNSAFETADSLLGHAAMVHLASPNPLRLAWNTKHPGHVRGMYGMLLDSYQFKTLDSVLDCTVDSIRRQGDRYIVDITYTHADGERATLEYESVIRCTGFQMRRDIFADDCLPELAPGNRIPAINPDWQSVNVDGLYFAGTMMQARDFKRASSAFIDGFRYNLRTMRRLLSERYDGVPLPRHEVPVAGLTESILDRVNWSSALWTQFEYLCDAIVLSDDGERAWRYEDLPEDYAVRRFRDLYTVTLRWGRANHPDIFAIQRHPQPENAAKSAFIHPVIRRYEHGRLVDELHLLEDLLADWRQPERHITPLREFLAGKP